MRYEISAATFEICWVAIPVKNQTVFSWKQNILDGNTKIVPDYCLEYWTNMNDIDDGNCVIAKKIQVYSYPCCMIV